MERRVEVEIGGVEAALILVLLVNGVRLRLPDSFPRSRPFETAVQADARQVSEEHVGKLEKKFESVSN